MGKSCLAERFERPRSWAEPNVDALVGTGRSGEREGGAGGAEVGAPCSKLGSLSLRIRAESASEAMMSVRDQDVGMFDETNQESVQRWSRKDVFMRDPRSVTWLVLDD